MTTYLLLALDGDEPLDAFVMREFDSTARCERPFPDEPSLLCGDTLHAGPPYYDHEFTSRNVVPLSPAWTGNDRGLFRTYEVEGFSIGVMKTKG